MAEDQVDVGAGFVPNWMDCRGLSCGTVIFGVAGQACDSIGLSSILFLRSTRSVSMTAFGEAILPNLQDVLNAKAALTGKASELANPDQQVIRIRISPLINGSLSEALVAAFSRRSLSNVLLREMNLFEMKRLLDARQLEFFFGPAALNDADTETQKCLFVQGKIDFCTQPECDELPAFSATDSLEGHCCRNTSNGS
ncbi:MAG: LysR family transcriptional regulator [Aestuariivirga sp.]